MDQSMTMCMQSADEEVRVTVEGVAHAGRVTGPGCCSRNASRRSDRAADSCGARFRLANRPAAATTAASSECGGGVRFLCRSRSEYRTRSERDGKRVLCPMAGKGVAVVRALFSHPGLSTLRAGVR